jgi:hypothetical protein
LTECNQTSSLVKENKTTWLKKSHHRNDSGVIKEFHNQMHPSTLGSVNGRICMEPDDEVQETGDWDRLSHPTLTDISHIGGRVEYD